MEEPVPSNPVANVVKIRANVEDLAGTARVTSVKGELDAVLDSNVLFAKDSAQLRPEARARLAEVGEQIRAAGPGTLAIVGHTDDLGSAEHGLELSKQRAEAVRTELQPYPGSVSVTVEGRGQVEPLVPNTDEESRARNRRVELHYVHS